MQKIGVVLLLLLSVFLSLFVFCLLLFVPPSGGPGPAPLPWLGGVRLAVCRSAWRCPAVRLGGLTWGVGLGLGGSGDPRSAVRGGRSLARARAYLVLLWWLRPARSVRLAPAPSRIVRCPSVSPWRSGSSAVRLRLGCRADLGAVAPSPSVCRPRCCVRLRLAVAPSRSGRVAPLSALIGSAGRRSGPPSGRRCRSAGRRSLGAGRRGSSARALRSASGGGRRVGWIGGRVGPAPPRFRLVSTF